MECCFFSFLVSFLCKQIFSVATEQNKINQKGLWLTGKTRRAETGHPAKVEPSLHNSHSCLYATPVCTFFLSGNTPLTSVSPDSVFPAPLDELFSKCNKFFKSLLLIS